ncbi:hypothetical protein BGZ76_008603 [Entomortierella beljakovae]|nr:hypothetical protein BGZ76_008603 [Entomortierella beljakovae]
MHLSIAHLITFSAIFILLLSSQTAQAQEPLIPPPPPHAGLTVNLFYSNYTNIDIGSEDVPFNTCFNSEIAAGKYEYVAFAPKNATINFFKEANCQDFGFGLDGYHNGYPGSAKSFIWVGWTEDSLGQLFDKEPIQGQGDAAKGGYTTPPLPPPPSQQNPGGDDGAGNKPEPSAPDGDDSTSGSGGSFFGIVFVTLLVLGVGGYFLWKSISNLLKEDKKGKGKSVLPYSRVNTEADGDILLTTKSRSHNFKLGDDEEDEEDDVVVVDNDNEIQVHPIQNGQGSSHSRA